jgi:Spy/CpxP family protein refolding chaperone
MRCAATLALLLLAPPLGAQAPARTDTTPRFVFQFAFAFNPDWVLEHRDQVALGDGQERAIRLAIARVADAFGPVKVRLDREQLRLDALLSASPVDEGAALAALERVLALESELKRLRLRLMIRTRNTLTPAQQRLLLQLPEARK